MVPRRAPSPRGSASLGVTSVRRRAAGPELGSVITFSPLATVGKASLRSWIYNYALKRRGAFFNTYAVVLFPRCQPPQCGGRHRCERKEKKMNDKPPKRRRTQSSFRRYRFAAGIAEMSAIGGRLPAHKCAPAASKRQRLHSALRAPPLRLPFWAGGLSAYPLLSPSRGEGEEPQEIDLSRRRCYSTTTATGKRSTLRFDFFSAKKNYAVDPCPTPCDVFSRRER